MRASAAFAALALFLHFPAAAQPVSDAESHIASAFTSRSDPRVLAEGVRIGPALREHVGAHADRAKVYAALVERISGRFFRVDRVPARDVGEYALMAGGNPADPLIIVDAVDAAFLMQYAPKERHVAYVEQVRGPAPKPAAEAPPPAPAPEPEPAKPQAEVELPAEPLKPAPVLEVPLPAEAPPPPPPPVVVEKPAPPTPMVEKPAAVVQKPKPVPATPRAVVQKPTVSAKPKPRGECVIKPVMTDDDLYNCSAPSPSRPMSSESLPPPAAVPKPQARAPEPRRATDCVIKPVMTDDELRACGAGR